MIKKHFISLASIVLLVGLFLAAPTATLATSVDRLSLCNLEGHPGETIRAQITLGGTDAGERTGFWQKHYKQMDGDDDRMDITSWITIEPEEYSIAQGQSITFIVKVKIPDSASPGLWGATSEDAGQTGHSAERRTYLIFKDTPTGGNAYSGLLIPVSVRILGETSTLTQVVSPTQTQVLPTSTTAQSGIKSSVLNSVKDNLIVIIVGAIIIILLLLILVRMRARRER